VLWCPMMSSDASDIGSMANGLSGGFDLERAAVWCGTLMTIAVIWLSSKLGPLVTYGLLLPMMGRLVHKVTLGDLQVTHASPSL